MSVYIRGMEMPEIEGNRAIRAEIRQLDGKLEFGIMTSGYHCCQHWTYYPLVPVTPHGRLIDADAFIEDECNHCDGACEAMPCNCLTCKEDCRCDLILDIVDAPTIIPAEEGER